jgi:hypothetical protein
MPTHSSASFLMHVQTRETTFIHVYCTERDLALSQSTSILGAICKLPRKHGGAASPAPLPVAIPPYTGVAIARRT